MFGHVKHPGPGLGVVVMGPVVAAPSLDDGESSDDGSDNLDDDERRLEPELPSPSSPHPEVASQLNLDVSAMIAFVSDVTHGATDPELFLDPNLARMAEEERREPALPVLEEAMQVTIPKDTVSTAF